jgi:N-acetylglucosaminyl-diphospho-decaprenol L-rhamnosyltransferase
MGVHPGSGIAVVLVNYRCLALIERHLRSGSLVGLEVVLVDNASDPGAIEKLGLSHGARVVLVDHNSGFAGGMNRGIASIADVPVDAYLLLNPDVEITRSQIDELLHALREGDHVAVAPVVVDDAGRAWVSSAGGPITVRAVLWYFLGISHLLPRLSGFFWTRRQVKGPSTLQPSWLCGAALMIDAAAWRRFGPLPEHEIVYGEDALWGNWCTRAGATLELVRSVTVRHSGGASGGSEAWVDATARMFVREMGSVRGRLAARTMRFGLAARALLRRAMTCIVRR